MKLARPCPFRRRHTAPLLLLELTACLLVSKPSHILSTPAFPPSLHSQFPHSFNSTLRKVFLTHPHSVFHPRNIVYSRYTFFFIMSLPTCSILYILHVYHICLFQYSEAKTFFFFARLKSSVKKRIASGT